MSCEGFQEDCIELINSYCSRNTTDFQLFCEEWKNKCFHYVFVGHTYQHELVHFTESCFVELKRLFTSFGTTNERLTTLYLMFAMYFKQPTKDFCKFRFTLADWRKMTLFYDTISNDAKYLQARTIFWRLWQANAFRFVECDMEQCFESLQISRYSNEMPSSYQKINTTIIGTVKELRDESRGLLPAIETLELGYNEMKEHFAKTARDLATLKNADLIGDIVARVEKVQKLFENDHVREGRKRLPRKQSSLNTSSSITGANDNESENEMSFSSVSESNDDMASEDSNENIEGDLLNIGSRRFHLRQKAMFKVNEGQRHLKSVLNLSPNTAATDSTNSQSPSKRKLKRRQSKSDTSTVVTPQKSLTKNPRIVNSNESIVINNPRKVYRRFSAKSSTIKRLLNECPPEVSKEVDPSKASRKRPKLTTKIE